MTARSINSQRVEDSRRRAILRGAISTPRGMLPPDAADALHWLRDRGYATSLTGCIARALIDAAERERSTASADTKPPRTSKMKTVRVSKTAYVSAAPQPSSSDPGMFVVCVKYRRRGRRVCSGLWTSSPRSGLPDQFSSRGLAIEAFGACVADASSRSIGVVDGGEA